MLIKNASLNLSLPAALPAGFCFMGTDHFQLDCLTQDCIKGFKALYPETERIIFELRSAEDWQALADEANQYAFFAQKRILEGRYDKKTLEKPGKDFLERYLQSPPKDCFLLLRMPKLLPKSMQAFAPPLVLVQAQLPSEARAKQWIESQLKQAGFRFEPAVPDLIWLANERNLAAIYQCIQRLVLSDPPKELSLALVQNELYHQAEFILFELPHFCFENKLERALYLLRQAKNGKEEPILILWVLSQALRRLLGLQQLLANNLSFSQACAEMKLWSTEQSFYQRAVKRYTPSFLKKLIEKADKLDKAIKTEASDPFQALERLTLDLALGHGL